VRTSVSCGLFLLVATAAMCPKPAPDLDGEPGAARLLEIGTTQADQLHCAAGDCQDWYRVQVPGQGDLTIEVRSPISSVADRVLVFALADGRGNQLHRATVSQTEGDASITWQANAGFYMVRVEARDDARAPLPYELTVEFSAPPPPLPPPPPPPPPEPRFETLQAELLEVEGDFSKPDAVLIDQGEQAGIRPGLTGRLVNGEDIIAIIEIIDTYPDGSRARVDDLSGPILPETRVEIDVPIDEGQ
jgi:hypothetical protein